MQLRALTLSGQPEPRKKWGLSEFYHPRSLWGMVSVIYVTTLLQTALTEFDGHFELSLPTASLSAPAHLTSWSPFQTVPPKPEGEADDADSDEGDEVCRRVDIFI